MMNSERWKRIEQVYQSVLASPPARRPTLLQKLCSNDPELRLEVESLLDARKQAGSFLSPWDLQQQIKQLASEAPLVGRTLGPYHVLSGIGAGAMGEVCLARDTRLDRRVALKILPAQFTLDSERVARFRREAKAASALNHPNIITIYDIGEIGEIWFIAAEFIEGMTLRERISKGKIELRELLGIAIQCTLALGTAHHAGIMHRDIKPENIMVRPDGVVKILDFGLARFGNVAEASGADSTRAGAIIGTPRYMSPEQARGQKLDPRTDIFSLGAVVYEMATGQPAFPGATPADVFAALLGSTCPPASESSALPEGLDTIIAKALQKDIEARYPTMQDFESDLQVLRQRVDLGLAVVKKKKRPARKFGALPREVWLGAPIAVALVAITLLGVRYLRNSTVPDRPEVPLSAVPLTSFGGYKDFGSFSPDGSQIAFSWNGGQGGSGGRLERSIYTKTLGPEDPIRLTSAPQDDVTPAWSPDGQYIAFCRALVRGPRPNRYAIYVVPSSGGQERQITEAGMGVSWSPDSKTLATASLADESGGISLISLETGQRTELTRPQPYVDNLPVFSPDGHWVAFTRDFGFSVREIFVVAARGGTARQLTFDRQPTYGVTWTADSREIVFASNRGVGGESLWRIPVEGGPPTRVSATLEGAFYPSISRRGNSLLYTESLKDTNIYGYDSSGFGDRPIPAHYSGPKDLILSSRRDDSPNISPFGGRIAFVSKRTGNEEIWVCDREGKHLVQLTFFKGPGAGTPRWSPDGRQIAFDSLAAGNSNIYLIDASGGSPRRLTRGSSANFMPSWSSDGKWIYFKSDRSGSDQIWKISVAGGDPKQITHKGASEGFASADGKLVYFTPRVWGPIWTVPVDGGTEQPVPELEAFDGIFRSWGVVRQGIYFISKQHTPRQTIRFFSFATRRVTPVTMLDCDPIWDYPDVALSRDGRQLLAACLDREVNDLMLIENFH